MKKGPDERIDEGVLQWYCHVERLESVRIAKRVCSNVLVVVQMD